jgi:hypothetical protein
MKGIIIAGVFVLIVAVILYHVIILHKTTGGLIGSMTHYFISLCHLVESSSISEAWLVQINGGGHGLMYQYPDKFSRVLLTFLES